MDTQLVTIGKISGVHGLKGNLKVLSYAESLALFTLEGGITLQDSRGKAQKATVTAINAQGRRLLMTLEGVADRNQAEALVGRRICVARYQLPEVEADTYYWTDLLGCMVHTRQARYLGQVENIIATGGNDVLVVKDPAQGSNHEVLLPMIASVMVEVDTTGKRLVVDLPPGLE